MPRITNSDQIFILLQSQLKRMEGTGKSPKKDKTSKTYQNTDDKPLDRIRALALVDNMEKEDVYRALISSLLTEEFGPAVSNDPEFQIIVDKVTTAITEERRGNDLLDAALEILKSRAS